MPPNYTSLVPLMDRVIIEPLKSPEKIGSIHLPEMAREKPEAGTVVAVGPGRWSETGVRIPMTVQVGDTVYFSRYTASEIRLDGNELRMLHEHEISCIVKK